MTIKNVDMDVQKGRIVGKVETERRVIVSDAEKYMSEDEDWLQVIDENEYDDDVKLSDSLEKKLSAYRSGNDVEDIPTGASGFMQLPDRMKKLIFRDRVTL